MTVTRVFKRQTMFWCLIQIQTVSNFAEVYLIELHVKLSVKVLR